MTRARRRLWIIAGLAAVWGALVAALIVTREGCLEARQGFDWLTWRCAGQPPPILLQRDLRRT